MCAFVRWFCPEPPASAEWKVLTPAGACSASAGRTATKAAASTAKTTIAPLAARLRERRALEREATAANVDLRWLRVLSGVSSDGRRACAMTMSPLPTAVFCGRSFGTLKVASWPFCRTASACHTLLPKHMCI